ncbi:hypothetical protein FG93_05946 [Bosea sp. LC85]|nr:hypothetical protein FG93_05946 [Bosea sp. LC85]
MPNDIAKDQALAKGQASAKDQAAVPTSETDQTRSLSPAAQRALAEAQARRAEIDAKAAAVKRDKELNGRGGLDPVRYDDWEVKGIASDF